MGIFEGNSESDRVWWYDRFLTTWSTAIPEICFWSMLNRQRSTVSGPDV